MPFISKLLSFLPTNSINISIVLPVYNAEKHLSKCLDSILGQGMDGIEIIAINDCSSDDSLKILRGYSQRHSIIKIINHTANKGAGAARNIALTKSRGKYITFIDSDDWFGDNYLKPLYKEAEDTGSDIVFSNMILVNDKSEQKYRLFEDTYKKYKNTGVSLNDLPCDWRSTAPWMKLFRKEFVINNNLKFMEGIRLGAEDIPFSWSSYFIARNISFCKDAFYYYNYLPESLDRHVSENILEIFDALEFTKNEYQRFDTTRTRQAQFNTLYISHVHYQFSKITNSNNADNIGLASKYWEIAHENLVHISKKYITDNVFLQEHEKDYYFDIITHPVFDLEMQNKYFSKLEHQ